MSDVAAMLRMLQHGDSAFPSGAVSFSWGLESLRNDGLVRTADDLDVFVEDQLRHRWATLDRSALAAAWNVASSLDAVVGHDRAMESQSLAGELREGSRRAGRVMLDVHERLETSGAAPYKARVRAGNAPGHIAVVQGHLWRHVGIALDEAEAMSASALCWTFTSAAVRMGFINHIDAQRLIARWQPLIAELLRSSALPVEEMHAFSPAAEIAAMRHETTDVRLFSN